MLLCAETMSGQPLKLLGLAGEYRASSKSGMLVNQALTIAAGRGAEVVFWDLAEQPLPLVGEEGCWNHPNVKDFQTLLESCDAFSYRHPSTMGRCQV